MAEENPPAETPKAEQPQITEAKPASPGGKSKWPLVIIGLLLLLLIPLGGYFLYAQFGPSKQTPVVTPTPTPSQTADEEVTPSPTPSEEKVKLTKLFKSAKFSGLSFEGYSLMYPADWTLNEQRDETTPISTVTLTKGTYSLKIFQAATGGAGCIYEGDLPEGPASDYRTNKYSDLITAFATLRQTEAPSNGKMAYSYCQKNTSDGSFGQPTSVGHMSATTGVANPDPEILSELEAIVQSLKTL